MITIEISKFNDGSSFNTHNGINGSLFDMYPILLKIYNTFNLTMLADDCMLHLWYKEGHFTEINILDFMMALVVYSAKRKHAVNDTVISLGISASYGVSGYGVNGIYCSEPDMIINGSLVLLSLDDIKNMSYDDIISSDECGVLSSLQWLFGGVE